MAVGFAQTVRTVDDQMEDILKKGKNFRKGFPTINERVASQRKNWEKDYSSRTYEYTKEELLAPFDDEFYVMDSPPPRKVRKSHRSFIPLIKGVAGPWCISTSWDENARFYDFTITTRVGSTTRFSPEAIETEVVNRYGREAYNQWRSMIFETIDDLAKLVKLVRKEINTIIPSITCSERSARLCRKVGIPVKQGVAFLVPYTSEK